MIPKQSSKSQFLMIKKNYLGIERQIMFTDKAWIQKNNRWA